MFPILSREKYCYTVGIVVSIENGSQTDVCGNGCNLGNSYNESPVLYFFFSFSRFF